MLVLSRIRSRHATPSPGRPCPPPRSSSCACSARPATARSAGCCAASRDAARSGAIGWRQTDLNWNTDKVRETLDYIKLKIDQGLPLYIGVNEGDTLQKIGESGRPINDAVTDHFLVIVGYTAVNTEPGMWPIEGGGWRIVRLQAIDNATYDEVRRFPEFDVTRYSIRKPAWHTIGPDAADREYQISQVRVYAEDVERMKDAEAWWN